MSEEAVEVEVERLGEFAPASRAWPEEPLVEWPPSELEALFDELVEQVKSW